MIIDWRRERILFLTALRFFTRIPVPSTVSHSDADLGASARYFPLVGLLVGLAGAVVYGIAIYIWPPAVALLLSIVTTVLLTGAFHEDGFADSCDGFGGGRRDRNRILEIMKDSRLGTYGALGLGLILALKFLSLEALDNADLVIPALLVGHTWSRLLAITYLSDLAYVGDPEQSKARPMATALGGLDLRIAIATVLPLLFLVSLWQFLVLAVVLLLWRWFFGYYMTKRIGGYTGDCLGAAQQVSEVLIYLVLVAL